MKSRIMKTIGLVAAMVACVGMTVCAAPSPSASTVVTGATTTAKDAKIIISEVPAEHASAVTEIKSEAGLKKALGNDFSANMTVADVVEATIEGPAPTGEFDITFNVKGVTASTKGQILHWNGQKWEKIPTKMGEGTMTGTFTSLSPVAFVVDKTTLASGTASSPKTSAAAVSGVAVLGLAAVAGAYGLKKKER